MYVSMCVCMYVCMYVGRYVCTYVCMYVCVYVVAGAVFTLPGRKPTRLRFSCHVVLGFERKVIWIMNR